MIQLVTDNTIQEIKVAHPEKEEHHLFLLNGYLNSHVIRNHSPKTIVKEKSFLHNWFRLQSENGPFYVWDAMTLPQGREVIIEYANNLIKTGITSKTVRYQLGVLSKFFSYVLEHSYVQNNGKYIRLEQLYGTLDQPVSEYDIPKHSYNGEQLGVPLDPELLYVFFHSLRKHYLIFDNSMSAVTKARNYTMAIIAAETGLRSDEITHLEIADLFFKSHKLQTRHAKGTRGSGKRARTTLFPPLARDSVRYYLKQYRPLITPVSNKYLFPNKQGLPLDYSSLQKALREMINVAQKNSIPILNHMGWHWFRRIFATRFIERFPHQLSALIELLGHTSPNTVHCYIKHSEAWMDKKIQQILEDSSSWPSIGD